MDPSSCLPYIVAEAVQDVPGDADPAHGAVQVYRAAAADQVQGQDACAADQPGHAPGGDTQAGPGLLRHGPGGEQGGGEGRLQPGLHRQVELCTTGISPENKHSRLLLMLAKLSANINSEDFDRLESALSPILHFGQEQVGHGNLITVV